MSEGPKTNRWQFYPWHRAPSAVMTKDEIEAFVAAMIEAGSNIPGDRDSRLCPG
jgi:hypothetical protein